MKRLSEEEKARLVKDVIDNFDFKKVNKVMKALDWTWRGKKPTIKEMISQAEELLYHVLNTDGCTSYGTGGFTAYRYENEISLVFAVENSSAWFGEDKSCFRIIKKSNYGQD